jgi:hypothetical protein
MTNPSVPNLDRSALLGILAQQPNNVLAELMGKSLRRRPNVQGKLASCAPSWTFKLRPSASAGSNRPIRT